MFTQDIVGLRCTAHNPFYARFGTIKGNIFYFYFLLLLLAAHYSLKEGSNIFSFFKRVIN